VLLVALVFGAALLLVVVSALLPRRVPVFVPRETVQVVPGVEDTVTIDARDPDRWRFFAFGGGSGLLRSSDTAGWDLGIRRFDVITSGGALRLDAPQAFDSLTIAPAGGYRATRFTPDTVNEALKHWYRYDFFAHLLRPAGGVYVLHTRRGEYVKLDILSYYCPGPEAGCLTFRYLVAAGPPANRRFR